MVRVGEAVIGIAGKRVSCWVWLVRWRRMGGLLSPAIFLTKICIVSDSSGDEDRELEVEEGMFAGWPGESLVVVEKRWRSCDDSR